MVDCGCFVQYQVMINSQNLQNQRKCKQTSESANKLLNQVPTNTTKQFILLSWEYQWQTTRTYLRTFSSRLCVWKRSVGESWFSSAFLCEHSSSWLRTYAGEPCRTETPSCFYTQHNIAIFGADFREHSSSWLRTFTLNLFRQNR